MSALRERELEEQVIQKLDRLTFDRKLLWKKEGQLYTSNFGDFVFEAEDSGQNWLTINRAGNISTMVIMNTAVVENLLETIKHIMPDSYQPRIPLYIGQHELELEALLEVLP
jgi:hypothetical protein